MNFALLGDDPQTLAAAAEATASGRHALVWAGDVRRVERLWEIAPAMKVSDDWQALVGGSIADVILVGRDEPENDRRAEQLRLLAQSGATLLVSHPISDSPLIYYELDMAAQESGARLVPLLGDRMRPAFRALVELAAQGEASAIGAVEQATFERLLADRSKESVLRHFARDADLLRALFGDMTRLSALGGSIEADRPDDEAAYAHLSVQTVGRDRRPIRWSTADGRREQLGRITLEGTRGRGVLTMPVDVAWRLEIVADDGAVETFPEDRPTLGAIDLLESIQKEGSSGGAANWLDATRAVELADAIEFSLRRGRTIDLHNETFSEQTTFKGMMGIVGCGLLLLCLATPFIAGALSAAASALGMKGLARFIGVWPLAILVLLGAFLLLQLLRVFVPPPRDP